MPNQARFTQNVNNPLLKTINSTSALMEFPTSTDRHLDVNIASADSGHGLATEAKQDDIINATNRAINNTGAIGDGSINATVVALGYDRSNGQGRALLVDADGNLQCDVVSGTITETNSADILADTTSIDGKITTCNTGAVVVASGDITETNSTAILADTGSLDTKIIACNTGAVVVASGDITETNSTAILADTASLDAKIVTSAPITSDGTTSAQAVNVMGSADGTNFRTLKTDGNGSLIVDPSEDSIITADGVTQEQRVMLNGNYNGNLRTVKVGDAGAVNTEIDHSWDNTNQIFNTEACADGDTITSSTFDLGQGVSHEIGSVEFFLDNSASVDIEVTGETSYNGTDFYTSGSEYSVNSNKGSIYFSQEDVGIGGGHRYMRLSVTNNNGLGTSTNISAQVGYYK